MSKVLLVEDDPTNRLVFKRVLTKLGKLEVHCTDDVAEVLDTAHSGQVDLILMDVGLPNSYHQGQPTNGLQITQILKADPETAHLPVILVTAFTMPGDREKFLKTSGADGYIPKPIIDHQAFVEEVVTFLAAAQNVG
ncbi:MAG: response regulator [Spirulina sp. SIO3F2]|nr:response regulator [Spirulina sp. SIO3F2]